MQPERVGTFRRVTPLTLATVLGALPCAPASAQETRAPSSSAPSAQTAPSSRDIPRPDQLEPGVNTTPTTTPAPAASDLTTGAVPAPQESAASAPPPPATQSSSASPAPAPPPAAAHKEARAAKAPGRKAGPDRIQLDPTDITGNRELPKVLYIVPWKHSDLRDLVGKPDNSLLDEVLQPLDRDVFRRENRYYDALPSGGGAGKTSAAQGSESKP